MILGLTPSAGALSQLVFELIFRPPLSAVAMNPPTGPPAETHYPESPKQ